LRLEERVIPVLNLGTYFKVNSPVAATDADDMRAFVYLCKDNQRAYSTFTFQHPNHPQNQLFSFSTPQQAWSYFAEAVSAGGLWTMALASLKRRVNSIALVPVPASCTTSTTTGERWGAKGLAEALARKGLGRVVQAAVNIEATEATRGKRRTASEINKNLRWYEEPRVGETVVYIDDVLTWGKHIAALDCFLGKPPGALAIAVACTDGRPEERAVAARLRKIVYSGLGDSQIQVYDTD
jgi:hypothetical protein